MKGRKKKPITQKQLDALKRGREIRDKNTLKRKEERRNKK